MNQIKRQIRYIIPLWMVLLITNWMPDNRISIKIRGFLASFFFRQCGKRLELGRDLTILNSDNIIIGNDTYIAKGTWLNGKGGIHIDDEVVIAPYVVISSMQHTFKNSSVRFGKSIAKAVHIGKGTWIAAHVSIKCGIKIGSGSIVAANSFVSSNISDNSINGGVPSRFIKQNSNN